MMCKTWTSEDKHQLFVDVKDEKAPHWAIQLLILILMATALFAACYL